MWFWIVVAIILAPIFIFSLALAVPAEAVFDMNVHGKPTLYAEVRWLFGLVTFHAGGRKTAVKPVKPVEREEKTASKTDFADILAYLNSGQKILQTRGLLREVKRLLARLLRSFTVRELAGEFTVGLYDPAFTGIFYGLLAATTIQFNWSFMKNIHFYPSFDRFVFEGHLRGIIRIQPIYLVASLFLFIFSIPLLRTLKTLVVIKWKRRKSRRRISYP